MTAPAELTRPKRTRAWLDLLILFALAALMTWFTWATWPDALVDWGTQLYLAWQVSIGKALYRDIAYFNGPLSIHFNALLFKLFGVHQRVIWFANLAILATIIVMIYTLLRDIGGRLAAITGGAIFILVFAFSGTNYNFVTPYTQEMTHGLALDLLAIIFLRRFQHRGRLLDVILCGACVGLSFLTRVELFLPGFLATTCGVALTLLVDRSRISKPWRVVGAFIASMLLPSLLAFMLLLMRMPASVALRGIAGSWPWVFDARVRQMSFYRRVSGADHLWQNMRLMFAWFVGYAVVLAIACALDAASAKFLTRSRDEHRAGRFNIIIAAFLIGAVSLYLTFQSQRILVIDALRPLPLILAAACAIAVWCLFRPETDEARTRDIIFRIVLLIFAGATLLKVALWTRPWHYGFVLTLPATLVMVALFMYSIPQSLQRRGSTGIVFASLSLGMLVAFTLANLSVAVSHSPENPATIATDGDQFYFDKTRGQEVNQALADIDRLVAPDQTLAVVPQGLMINYLTRHPHPNRFVNLMQPEVVTSGEDVVLQEWQTHPPDFVLMTRADVTDTGFKLIDDIYGEKLLAWIRQNYHEIASTSGEIQFSLMRRAKR
jgi:hypothetical protein